MPKDVIRVFADLEFEAEAEQAHGNFGWDYESRMWHFHEDRGWVMERTFSGRRDEVEVVASTTS